MLRALPYFYNAVVDAGKTARLLTWSDEYHAALGFALSLLYVLPRDMAAFEAHPGIRALVERQRLALVLWDQHAGFAEFKVRGGPAAGVGGPLPCRRRLAGPAACLRRCLWLCCHCHSASRAALSPCAFGRAEVEGL